MRFISTKVHGILDYVVGALLILAPWILGFSEYQRAAAVPVVLGIVVIGYSLFTNYEYGVIRKISMPVHLGLDFIVGVLLAVSPWLFQFDEIIVWPHVVVGILEIGASLATHTRPGLIPTTHGEPHAIPHG